MTAYIDEHERLAEENRRLRKENKALRAAMKGVEGVPRIRRNDYDAAWKAFDKALGDAS